MSKSILPDGYLPAEFLESTGTQYINTGIRPFTGAEKCTVGMEIDCLATGPGSNTNCMIAGCGQSGGGWFSPYRWWTEDAAYVSIYVQQHAYPVSSPYNNRIRCSLNFLESGVVKYSANGGDVLTKAITHTVKSYNRNIWLFGGDQTNVNPRAAARIWSAKISDGAALVRSYVPAISPAGVACMYDSVTMTPKYNAGSGSFIVGVSTEQTYALIDKLPVLATNSNFALTISLPYTAQYDTRLVDALNTTIDLYKLNLTVTYSDATTARALSIKEAYALPDILPKLTEETAATLAISLPYRAKYDTTLLASLEELATTLYWTITITYASPVYPEDFHPADFIYSDGTAYLDVPIATDCTDKAIKVRTQHLFDAAASGTTYGEGVSSGTNATTLNWSRVNTLFGGFAGNSSVTLQNPTLYTDKYNTIELEIADNATKLAINGSAATATHTDSTELPEVISQIGVFYMYGSTALLPGKKRFWQLTLDDKVFYNLVPALTWEGVPCMVNTLTNEFYTTAGAADFTIGLSEEQAYTALSTLLTTATTLPSIVLPYCARANKKIRALLSEFETTDWVSYSDPVYPDDCIAITSIMQNGTLVDTSGIIPCITIGDSWTNTISIYDLNLKEFFAVIPEYVAVISAEELRAIINRLENYVSVATNDTSFSVQLPYSAQFDTKLQTELIEFTAQSGYRVDVAYSNPIDYEDYIPATYLESSGEEPIRLENPEGDDYNEYTGVRAQLAAVEENEYNYLFYDFAALASLGLGISENNVWRAAYGTVTETTAPVELDEQTTIEFNYKDRRQLNIGPAYRQTLSKWDENMGFNSLRLFYPSQIASSNVAGWKLKAWRILFSHYDKVIHDLNPGITYDGIPCFVDVINNITHRVPSYVIGMTVTQLRNLRKLPVTTDGELNIQLPEYAVLDTEAIAAIEVAEANGWTIQFGYIPALFLEFTGTQRIYTGITATSETSATCLAEAAPETGTYRCLFGIRISPDGGATVESQFAVFTELRGSPYVNFRHAKENKNVNYIATGKLSRYELTPTYGDVDGNRVEFSNTTEWESGVISLGQLGREGLFFIGKIYNFSISRAGERQCNYIPVIDSAGVPCMWDRVTMTSKYDAYSGSFIVGLTTAQARKLWQLPADAEKKTLTISLPSEVVDGNGVLQDMAIFTAISAAVAKGWSFILQTHDGTTVETAVPAGYMECEFLEFTGTQRIYTGITATSETSATCLAEAAPETGTYRCLFGTRITPDGGATIVSQFIVMVESNWTPYVNFRRAKESLDTSYIGTGKLSRYELTPTYGDVDGNRVTFTDTSEWESGVISLGQLGREGLFFIGKIYSFALSRSGAAQCNYIPAISPDGTPCMWDSVTAQPFTKIGSGAFICGMTAAQAVQLANLPSGGGTLTVSLPQSILNEGGEIMNAAVNAALNKAANNGWIITIQTYTEGE